MQKRYNGLKLLHLEKRAAKNRFSKTHEDASSPTSQHKRSILELIHQLDKTCQCLIKALQIQNTSETGTLEGDAHSLNISFNDGIE